MEGRTTSYMAATGASVGGDEGEAAVMSPGEEAGAIALPAAGTAAVEVAEVEAPLSRTELAQRAFAAGDIEASIAAHGVQMEQHGGAGSDYVKSIVFGGLDGIITTFAVVASVQGAGLGTNIVLIMGVANLIADGVSMGFGEFLSGDAEKKYILSERGRESWEMKNNPEGEVEEMIELYEKKGFSNEDATVIVKTMAKNTEFFIDHMMVEELGMLTPDADDSPFKQGLAMFCSFMLFGFIPLLSFVAFSEVGLNEDEEGDTLFGVACGLTAVALFGLGAFSSKFNNSHWFKTGLWVLGNGLTASSVAYLVGYALAQITEIDADCKSSIKMIAGNITALDSGALQSQLWSDCL